VLLRHALSLGALASVLFFAGSARATNYSLYIHGRDTTNGGTPSGWNYWVDYYNVQIAQGKGVNAIPVDYNGEAHISVSNPTVVAALNTYCTGSNACYIQCHSAGCAQIAYAEAYYPKAWNIIWVLAAGSAEGGSEIANAGQWLTGYPIDSDLTVSTMRAMFDHDTLGDSISGRVYTYMGGMYYGATTCLFPGGCTLGTGGNDSAVAFHSSGRYRSSGTYGTASATGTAGGTYWDYTDTLFVDSIHGSYGHCVAWSTGCEEGWYIPTSDVGGIAGVMAGAAASYDQ
jgi:hypothetical protein